MQEALRIFALAFPLNWLWEATHASSYVETTGPFPHRLRHCLPMAGTDAVWTLALWAIGKGAIRRREAAWRFTAMAALGAVSAVVAERMALSSGRWSDNALMPRLPIRGVEFWPVAQLTILPVLTV